MIHYSKPNIDCTILHNKPRETNEDQLYKLFKIEWIIVCIWRGSIACSAGLKNTVTADCCERKILFWQDVNSDLLSGLASQPAGNQPAEQPARFS